MPGAQLPDESVDEGTIENQVVDQISISKYVF